MRTIPLACLLVLTFFAWEAAAASELLNTDVMLAEMKPNAAPFDEQDPGIRSARAMECAQKADARNLEGKTRRRFLRSCRSGA